MLSLSLTSSLSLLLLSMCLGQLILLDVVAVVTDYTGSVLTWRTLTVTILVVFIFIVLLEMLMVLVVWLLGC